MSQVVSAVKIQPVTWRHLMVPSPTMAHLIMSHIITITRSFSRSLYGIVWEVRRSANDYFWWAFGHIHDILLIEKISTQGLRLKRVLSHWSRVFDFTELTKPLKTQIQHIYEEWFQMYIIFAFKEKGLWNIWTCIFMFEMSISFTVKIYINCKGTFKRQRDKMSARDKIWLLFGQLKC